MAVGHNKPSLPANEAFRDAVTLQGYERVCMCAYKTSQTLSSEDTVDDRAQKGPIKAFHSVQQPPSQGGSLPEGLCTGVSITLIASAVRLCGEPK